jgi:transposase
MRAYGSQISANRAQGAELSVAQRDSIISKREAGSTTKELAEEFACSRRAIQKTIQRWDSTGSNYSRPRTGQPPKLSRREKRYAYRLARQYPKIEYAAMLKDLGLVSSDGDRPSVSTQTLRAALQDQGLQNFRAKRRPKINAGIAAQRLRYARDYQGFNYQRCIIRFGDECSVQRGSGRNKEWSFGYPDEKYDHDKVTEVSTAQGKQQMVWASIWITPGGRVGRSPLVIMERDYTAARHGYTGWSYTNALDEGLLPTYCPGERFLQDNARVHTSQWTKDYLERHGIWCLEHPPYSPDLNPIEHMWWALKRTMHQCFPEFDTIGESQEDWDRFCAALKEAWQMVPDALVRKLIHSMPRRLEAVIRAHGYQTKY